MQHEAGLCPASAATISQNGKLTKLKFTLIGSSENAIGGYSYPYNSSDRATPLSGPRRSSWDFVNVKAWARMYRESIQVQRAPKTGTPSTLAMCLLICYEYSQPQVATKVMHKKQTL